jgi:hypothetical protein
MGVFIGVRQASHTASAKMAVFYFVINALRDFVSILMLLCAVNVGLF